MVRCWVRLGMEMVIVCEDGRKMCSLVIVSVFYVVGVVVFLG